MRGGEDIEARIAAARRGTVRGGQDQAIQRAIGDYLKRYVDPLKRDFTIAKERLERLAGIRGSTGDHAVRKSELSSVKNIDLEAETVAASPTADQHNALVRDLRRIRDALNRLS